jgi:hypothetical protein
MRASIIAAAAIIAAPTIIAVTVAAVASAIITAAIITTAVIAAAAIIAVVVTTAAAGCDRGTNAETDEAGTDRDGGIVAAAMVTPARFRRGGTRGHGCRNQGNAHAFLQYAFHDKTLLVTTTRKG